MVQLVNGCSEVRARADRPRLLELTENVPHKRGFVGKQGVQGDLTIFRRGATLFNAMLTRSTLTPKRIPPLTAFISHHDSDIQANLKVKEA
jgi:hypothetical protein